MDAVEKKEETKSVSFLKGVALEAFSKCFSGVWFMGQREFAEFSSELLSLLSGKLTPCLLIFNFHNIFNFIMYLCVTIFSVYVWFLNIIRYI